MRHFRISAVESSSQPCGTRVPGYPGRSTRVHPGYLPGVPGGTRYGVPGPGTPRGPPVPGTPAPVPGHSSPASFSVAKVTVFMEERIAFFATAKKL
eukprot:3524456-Rhodomonas_salina.1